MGPKKGGSRRGHNSAASHVPTNTVPDSDFIVFGDGKKPKKGKSAKDAPQEVETGPPKPTVKQVIGGASWTGKLPVNLLSEHCQKQKWNRPEYDMRQTPGKDGADKMYRSAVTLSRLDPKTRETVALPPLRLPAEHIRLSDEATALEARHFAATYALFRISSMKNIHMTLPPKYRDLWKGEFSQMKKDDVGEGRAWKYEEDPFAAESKRQEILRDIEKRKQEQQKREQSAAEQSSLNMPGRSNANLKIWEKAPKVEMGPDTRTEVERIVRTDAHWNPYGLSLTKAIRSEILSQTVKLGFRASHVEEALEVCKDKEEVLEWLLIHVPEDDLPQWALPANYSAGVTLASSDLVRESKLRDLAIAGYSADMCVVALRDASGDELLAAQLLQKNLLELQPSDHSKAPDSFPIWNEELQALEAVYGELFSTNSKGKCCIDVKNDQGSSYKLIFRCPERGYPGTEIPTIAIESKQIPAYIRLSAIRQAASYAYQNLLGEMMIFSICQWLENALPQILESPGRLSELHPQPLTITTPGSRVGGNNKDPSNRSAKSRAAQRRNKDSRTSNIILNDWNLHQKQPAQLQMLQQRQKLPAWSKKEDILRAIDEHQIVIVSGETGSGKSTQVVQFVLDHEIEAQRGASVNILCTQPRRVATLSLADRVSSERCMPVGREVGYVIRGESHVSNETKVTFMTTGVLLRRMQSAENMTQALEGISHIFIDEVHERSLDTDFLLALLRDSLKTQPGLKIVLMSATLDAEIFTAYFGGRSHVALEHIEGRTFPVTDLYLDHILSMTRYGGLQEEEDPRKAIQGLGAGINYDLIRNLVDCIHHELGDSKGSILIFLPGTMEIDRCLRALGSMPVIHGLPLHASLLPIEQRKVFQPAPPGRRKVIAATNVAETSITIEDVVAVIDTGRVKETNYDPANNIVRLEEVWASQAACKQRRGRAGRVRAGTCYKLFTQNTESKMSPKPLPEIRRVPLEQLCLSVKSTGAGADVAKFLARTLTPPDGSAVSNALKNLHVMGALEDNQLTPLGVYMSLIPADLRCAKLLIYGAIFGVLEPSLTIASILTVRSPFVSPKDKRDEANEARMSFPSKHGDLMLDMAAYDEWSTVSNRSRSSELREWCNSNFMSPQTLRDISSTRRQLLDSMKDAGLVQWNYKSLQAETATGVGAGPTADNTHQYLLLRALITAALQPQVALIQLPSKKYISSISGAKELDPDAKTIKFWVSNATSDHETAIASTSSLASSASTPATTTSVASIDGSLDGRSSNTPEQAPLTRVFIHPSSSLFTSQTFPYNATHLTYFTKVYTSKPFLRDLTPLNIYSLLLFGGKLEVDTSGLGIIVGGTWRVRGWARIGVLVNRLRRLLDDDLRCAIEDLEHGDQGDTHGHGNNNNNSTYGRGDKRALKETTLMGRMVDSKAAALAKRLIVLNGQDV